MRLFDLRYELEKITKDEDLAYDLSMWLMAKGLYEGIDLPSEEEVQYIGCYVLKWGKEDEPSMGFRKWIE